VQKKEKPTGEPETLRAIFEARGDAALEDPLFWQRLKTTARLARTPVEYSAPSEPDDEGKWDVARLATEMAKDGHLFDSEEDPGRRRQSDAARAELEELFDAMTSRKGVRPPRSMAAAVATMRVLNREPLETTSKTAHVAPASLTPRRSLSRSARIRTSPVHLD
jgi:hypothetical protein